MSCLALLALPLRLFNASAARRYLAWRSIFDEREILNLDPHQVRQAETQMKAADDAVTARVRETYQWLLVPTQASPQAGVSLTVMRITGSDALAVRASRKLKNDELLIVDFAPTMLRKAMDGVSLWRGDHVAVKQLIEDFAKYLCLPRLRGPEVLVRAIGEGVGRLTWSSETFGLADSWDEKKATYLGLRGGKPASVSVDSMGVLVKPETALRQLDAERPQESPELEPGEGDLSRRPGMEPPPEPGPRPRLLRRFHGSVALDANRLGRDAGRIAEEVVQHLTTQKNATVRLTLEIEAEVPEGAPDNIVRIVTENARTLKFRTHGFEEE